jgi:hypothetical protein
VLRADGEWLAVAQLGTTNAPPRDHARPESLVNYYDYLVVRARLPHDSTFVVKHIVRACVRARVAHTHLTPSLQRKLPADKPHRDRLRARFTEPGEPGTPAPRMNV